MNPVSWDEKQSNLRAESLRKYYADHVLDGGQFRCAFAARCQASLPAEVQFFEGQLSHVGPRYETFVGGVPVRILVVAMSYGHGPSHVSMRDRSAMVDADGRRDFAAVPSGVRTKHMQGTILVLRELLGVHGVDHRSEYVSQSEAPRGHLYEHFAFVNALLCSAVDAAGGKKDHGTSTMRRNCLQHLRAAVEILAPTIVIVQGAEPAAALAPLMAKESKLLGTLRAGASTAVCCTLSHPSSPSNGWSTTNFAQWRNVVRPTLLEARRRAGIAG